MQMETLLFYSLNQAISSIFGENVRITSKRPIYGGDISQSYRLSLSNQSNVFMKCNSLSNLPFFQAEITGLDVLRKTNTIGVPKTFGIGIDKLQGISFLLMEYLETAPKISNYWEVFGRELAALHRADCPSFANLPFGFASDNYIGASPQINTPKETWVSFFRDCRLLPQIKMAQPYLDSKMRRQCVKLLDHLDSYLSEPEFPSFLHGDLWSGNAVCGPDGKAWIIDPAVYIGHFEAELAMTELFGGYPHSFYKAYHEANKIDNAYRDRKDLYNLYHLLNHLNLFGGGYRGSVQSILNRYCS